MMCCPLPRAVQTITTHTIIEKPGGYVTRFSCWAAVSWTCYGSPRKHFSGTREIKSSLLQNLEALGFGPRNRHAD